MTEPQLTSRLKRDLAAATGGHVIKHCDRFTAGVPDLSVTVRGTTTWLEVKMRGNRATPLQLWTMARLGRAITVTWRGTIRAGEGEISWRGVDHVGAAMGYAEMVKMLRKICTDKDFR